MPNADLRAFYVWLPMLPADSEAAARTAAKRFAAPRATHYWDPNRHLSRRMARALAIDTRCSAAPGDDPPFAWDVYLAYRRRNADITAADLWMHQLAIDHAPRFEAAEWSRRVAEMLNDAGV